MSWLLAARVRSVWKMPSGSPLSNVNGPRRKRPRWMQSVRTTQRWVRRRRSALTTRLARCHGRVDSSRSSTHSLGQKLWLVTSNCSSAYWPTWLRRVEVVRRIASPRTLFQAQSALSSSVAVSR